jgi:hypothetical protein
MENALPFIQQNIPDKIAAMTDEYVDLRINQDEVDTINRRLMDNNLVIYGLNAVEISLEQSYMEITGGGNVIV